MEIFETIIFILYILHFALSIFMILVDSHRGNDITPFQHLVMFGGMAVIFLVDGIVHLIAA